MLLRGCGLQWNWRRRFRRSRQLPTGRKFQELIGRRRCCICAYQVLVPAAPPCFFTMIQNHPCRISIFQKKNMTHQPQDETKQPPPSPSTETNTALTTTSNMYLSTHLIVPYFVTPNGEIKRPEHLIAWWSRIFSFYVPDDKDHIELRSLCRLFRDALKPPPLYTIFPHSNYPTLDGLVDSLNNVYQTNPNKAPKIMFVMKGINYPLIMIGARCWTKQYFSFWL